MRNSIYASVVALALAVAGSSFAAGAAAHTSGGAPMCESVFGGTAGGDSTTGGGFDFGQGKWAFGANAAYHHLFFDPIQLGGSLNFGFANNGTATGYSVGLLVGPTFNFMNTVAGDISDAVFLFAGVGFNMSKPGGGVSTTDFQFGAELGKRFKVWDNISYRPSFSFSKVGSGMVAFHVNLLNVSVLY